MLENADWESCKTTSADILRPYLERYPSTSPEKDRTRTIATTKLKVIRGNKLALLW